MEEETVEKTWKGIEDIVIKTLLSADTTIRRKFAKRSSMYNCYSLTGKET